MSKKKTALWAMRFVVLMLAALAAGNLTAQAQSGSIRGGVFTDSNRNGRWDAGELGVANVPIVMSVNGQTLRFTSGNDGTYAPVALASGNYWVQITPPDGCWTTNAKGRAVYLPPGGLVEHINFGLQCGVAQQPPTPSSPGGSPSFQPLPNAVAWYAFDGSGAVLQDKIAGNHGSTTGNVTRITGVAGNGLSLRGGQGNLPHSQGVAFGGGDFSISLWIKTTDRNGVKNIVDKRIFNRAGGGNNAGAIIGYQFFLNNGHLGMQLADGNGSRLSCNPSDATPSCSNYFSSKSYVADGKWHFVAVTVDRNSSQGLRLFVDGRNTDAFSPTGRQGSLANGEPIKLAGDYSVDMDDLRFFNRVLSFNEIGSLAGGAAPAPNPAPQPTPPPPRFNCATAREISRSECQALVDLFLSTQGDGWKRKDGWLLWQEPCAWWGVECENGHVTMLKLHINNLRGRLPASLGNLTYLRKLVLSFNQLSGNIPAQLGRIPHLGQLFLNNNQLSGWIPVELGNPSNFDIIDLSFNQLGGIIPTSFGDLSQLQMLLLHNNQISGALPHQLGNLSRLMTLNAGNNQLYGPIPRSYGNLPSLVTLDVRNNHRMTGYIPTELTRLPALQHFYYHGTKLCEPQDPTYLAWIEGFGLGRVGRSGYQCPPW